MVWPAIIGAVGAIGGGLLAGRGQKDANRMNLNIWREQRDWMTDMSNTEMQRRVQDLIAAGLNPMLAIGGNGASTPSTPMPTMQNEDAALAAGVSSAAQLSAMAASIELAKAQARKTNAEAAVTEAEVPYSAGNAALRRENLFTEMHQRLQELSQAKLETASKEVQLKELQPLAVKLEQLLVEARRLEMSEKEAISALYESVKGMKGVEKLLPLIISIMHRR